MLVSFTAQHRRHVHAQALMSAPERRARATAAQGKEQPRMRSGERLKLQLAAAVSSLPTVSFATARYLRFACG